MEELLQQSVNTAESVSLHTKSTLEAVNKMGAKHISAAVSLVRNACDNNMQHDNEINSARLTAEEAVVKNSGDLIEQFDVMSAQEQECITGVVDMAKIHANTLEALREDHSSQTASIEHKSRETFQQFYRDYEPSGTTPLKCDPDVPSKGTIDSLRSLPMEQLVEEFRENNSYESSNEKEMKPSLIPRSPFSQLN
ncbi:hypothetical protein Lalb_Chr01g0018071 [Lupinus albus]|uniref:Uncharacterized protein n=1 Tax=Lupinus albus TaxID=3870 RepID=A0A6A4R4D3_LUPAL|nr:hypothetical protein Lalb_Chr01g0018071 [Lupinus albus]